MVLDLEPCRNIRLIGTTSTRGLGAEFHVRRYDCCTVPGKKLCKLIVNRRKDGYAIIVVILQQRPGKPRRSQSGAGRGSPAGHTEHVSYVLRALRGGAGA